MFPSTSHLFKSAVERLAKTHMQEHLDKYVKGEVNTSASRVLFTQWVGQAWEEVSGNREMVICSFEKLVSVYLRMGQVIMSSTLA